jgi:small subunit ribosomal protein S4
LVNKGDRITVKPSERSKKFVREALGDGGPPVQAWLKLEPQQLEGVVDALPTREDVQIPVEEQLIIEMCSR